MVCVRVSGLDVAFNSAQGAICVASGFDGGCMVARHIPKSWVPVLGSDSCISFSGAVTGYSFFRRGHFF